jgi:hypothetical protein
MRVWHKVAVVVLGAACAAAAGAAVTAVAAPAGGSHHQGTSHQSAVATGAVDSTTESKFTPIQPCRIVDTRVGGGAMKAGVARSFIAVGTTGFSAQGGNSAGCGIPSGATAIDVSFQATAATGSGFVNETAFGSAFANASLLHYVSGQTIGTGSTFPINGTAAHAFTLKASAHQVELIVDVVGYYTKPMTATVLSTGAIVASSRVLSVTGSAGQYDVQFDRSVVGCNYQASLFITGQNVVISVGRLSTSTDTLLVETTISGTLTAETFYVSVTC